MKMTMTYSLQLLMVFISFTSTMAADHMVLVPLLSDKNKITCGGTLNGTRWCDNGDGTVTDLTTGLVWLQDANCFGTTEWEDGTFTGALTLTGKLSAPSCSLSDGSVGGDWRLPTFNELDELPHGTEAVSYNYQRSFSNVQAYYYWTSSTHLPDSEYARLVSLVNGLSATTKKNNATNHYVLPVRGRK